MTDVTIIGGGAVGLASAWQMAKDGVNVTIVEPGEPRFGTSMANAGWVSPSHIIPFAAPGMVQIGIKNLIGRTGAFGISPSAGPLLASWMLKFASSCTDKHVEQGAPALKELLDTSIDLVNHLCDTTDLERTREPLWYLYTQDNAEAAAQHEVDLLNHYGTPCARIEPEDAISREPILKNNIKAVVEFTTDFGIDPAHLVEILQDKCKSMGVTFRNEKVTGLNATSKNVTIITENDSWVSDTIVIAAGAWTREVAKFVGANLPIMAAKGHSVTLPDLDNMPKRTFMMENERIATNPLSWGLRMSTGYELTSSNDRTIVMKQVDKMIDRARTVFHLPEQLPIRNEWTGLRPSSPDGLPYIGALPGSPRVIIASGHGMLGLMMAPGTGKFVSDFVAGRPVSTDILKFSPARP